MDSESILGSVQGFCVCGDCPWWCLRRGLRVSRNCGWDGGMCAVCVRRPDVRRVWAEYVCVAGCVRWRQRWCVLVMMMPALSVVYVLNCA